MVEIYRVDYCKGNDDIMQSALFDNIISAKKYFDDFVNDYNVCGLGKGNYIAIWRLPARSDGQFLATELLKIHQF